MKYKIKSMKLKKQPTKKTGRVLIPRDAIEIPGGVIGITTNQYDIFSDLFIEFYPDDESLPALPLVTITHEDVESRDDEIRMYVFDGTDCEKYDDKWSIKELTELAEEG